MRFKPQSYEKYSDKFLHEFKIVLIFPARTSTHFSVRTEEALNIVNIFATEGGMCNFAPIWADYGHARSILK